MSFQASELIVSKNQQQRTRKYPSSTLNYAFRLVAVTTTCLLRNLPYIFMLRLEENGVLSQKVFIILAYFCIINI